MNFHCGTENQIPRWTSMKSLFYPPAGKNYNKYRIFTLSVICKENGIMDNTNRDIYCDGYD